jgi:glycine cleavage system H protein
MEMGGQSNERTIRQTRRSIMVALLVVLTVLVFLTVDYFLQRRRALSAVAENGPARAGLFGRAGYRVPQGVFFAPGHTWFHLEDSGVARVGVDDFATSIVGDIDEITSRQPGEAVRKGDVILRVRHGEREVAFRSPVDGVVREVNADILERRDILGVEPFTAAWLYRVKPEDTSGMLDGMMIGNTAKEWLRREASRLKVFLSTVSPQHPVLGTTMQDGGLPGYGLIDFVEEDDWKTLQEKFLA